MDQSPKRARLWSLRKVMGMNREDCETLQSRSHGSDRTIPEAGQELELNPAIPECSAQSRSTRAGLLIAPQPGPQPFAILRNVSIRDIWALKPDRASSFDA